MYAGEACVRRTYAYSPEVVETEASLRDLRAAERTNGVAEVETATGYVRVTRTPAARADHAAVEASGKPSRHASRIRLEGTNHPPAVAAKVTATVRQAP